ncbi:hypothetical protein [Rhizobium sp.]|jgi:hypothetical protein|uniref:vWA domain-containing protein n=1 Tax=Rhizobium sp. TaxID=391 RepID=UPI002AA8E3E5
MSEFDQQPFADADLKSNPQPRCPCVLILDVSGSMGGRPIDELNQGLRALQEEIKSDSLAAKGNVGVEHRLHPSVGTRCCTLAEGPETLN